VEVTATFQKLEGTEITAESPKAPKKTKHKVHEEDR